MLAPTSEITSSRVETLVPPASHVSAPVLLLAGSGNHPLANAIGVELGLRVGSCTLERFPDGESFVALNEGVRGHEVILLQPTSPPVNDNLMQLLALADACRHAAAERIVAVIPYFGYARSDRRDGRRTPVMASLAATLVQTAGIDQVVTLDVHTPTIEGFFRVPVDNVTAVPLLAEALRSRISPDTIIVAPDVGALRLANRYARHLGLPVAVCHKHRVTATEVNVARITGDVAGRPCLVVDDMITTGGTVIESIRALTAAGAPKEIRVAATHAVLVPGALERIVDAGIEEILVTDSIPVVPRRLGRAQLDVVSVAPLLATVIRRLLDGGSLREMA